MALQTALQGSALAKHQEALIENPNVTCANMMSDLAKTVFLAKAIINAKWYLCHEACKAHNATVHETATAALRMNKELRFYPDYSESEKLDEDELAKIFESMSPWKWQEDMVEHDCSATNSKLEENP